MMIEAMTTAVLLALLVGVFSGYFFCSHRYAKEVQTFAAEAEASYDFMNKTKERLREANEALQVKDKNARILTAELDKVTKKLEAALSANYNFEKSRDEAWDLYRRSSISAGNAQSLLFKEIQKLSNIVNKYRIKNGEEAIKTPQDLETMIAEFSETHIEEAKRKAQQL